MTSPPGDQADPAGLSFATDRLAMNIHGDADSHLDALCHVIYHASLYNGVPADTITSTGAARLSVEVARDRSPGGVLLDIPRLRGVPWLEPGDHVSTDDLVAAEQAQQVRVGQGDLLFVRVGHRRRRASWARGTRPPPGRGCTRPRWSSSPTGRSRCSAATATTTRPAAGHRPVDFPVHVLAINALGVHLLDYLQFEELVPACEQAGRWSFLCVIAPLRLRAGPGSPVNPIAIL